MTWANVKTWDPPTSCILADMADVWDQVFTELFDIWLPTLGHVISNNGTRSRRWIHYSTNVKDGTDYPNYAWFVWTPSASKGSVQISYREDAKFDVVPGDQGTTLDPAISGPAQDADRLSTGWLPIRLWTSDQEPTNFLLTQGGVVYLCWIKPTVKIWKDYRYPDWEAGGSDHRNSTHITPMLTGEYSFRCWNAPSDFPNSTFNQRSLGFPIFGDVYKTTNAILHSPIRAKLDSLGACSVVSYPWNDVAQYDMQASERFPTTRDAPAPDYGSSDDMHDINSRLYRVLVNNTEWWLVFGSPYVQSGPSSGGPGQIKSKLAFKCSAELPPAP
jgi:hypothetical protein